MFMTQDVLNFVKEKTEALMAAPSCSREAKEAAKAWLDAVGTDKEAEETKKYIQELEGDIMPIDMLIDFAQSPAGGSCVWRPRSGCGRSCQRNQSRRRKILRLPGMCGSRGHSCKKG